MNRWKIPDWLDREVIARDRRCVYCGVEFLAANPTRRFKPSWEHIVNDARLVTRENIARCRVSCTASKGTKDLGAWLDSKFCKARGISEDTVAQKLERFLPAVGAQVLLAPNQAVNRTVLGAASPASAAGYLVR